MTKEEKIEILEKEKAYMIAHGGDRQAEALTSAIKVLEQEPSSDATIDEHYWKGFNNGIRTEKFRESKRQEPCEDAISRQAVFEQINCWIGSGEYRYTNATDYLNKRIKALQAVNPQESLTEEDYIELRDRFGEYVVFVVRDIVSGKGERWKKRSDKE